MKRDVKWAIMTFPEWDEFHFILHIGLANGVVECFQTIDFLYVNFEL